MSGGRGTFQWSAPAGAATGVDGRPSIDAAAVPADLVEVYLADLRRRPTASRAEVAALARAVQAGLLAEAAPPPASPSRRAHLALVAAEGRAAAEALVEANLRLVVMLAGRYRRGTALSILDLVQEGNLGLMRAVGRFDPERGYAFSTYAAWWIRAAMAAAVAKSAGRARRRSAPGDPSDPRSSEPVRLVSLSSAVGRNGRGLADVLPDHAAPSPADHVAAASLRPAVARLLSVLDERERLVLCWHFGLDRHPSRSLREIAAALGVSEERARQLEVAALAKLRRPGRRRDSALELLVG